ncbi:MAG: carbohydrate ABC transporter permease [Chloroflexota bacterium]
MSSEVLPARVRSGGRGWLTAATLLLLLAVLSPFLYLLQMSFKNELDALAMPPRLLFVPTLENYAGLLGSTFLGPLTNSIIVGTVTTVLSLVLGVPASYALARLRFRGESTVGLWVLATRMAPPVAFGIPFFLAYRNFGWLDTLHGLIIIYLTFNLSLVIWVMRSFFDGLPRSIEEAALIDGASSWQSFTQVTLPLTAPGIAATAIFSFLLAWNDFFYALVLTRSNAMTVPVAIVNFMNYQGWDWGSITAGSVIVTVPVLLFSLLVRRYLVSGLTAGAVKG